MPKLLDLSPIKLQALTDIVTEASHPGVLFQALPVADQDVMTLAAHELQMATMFIAQADKRHYGKLQEEQMILHVEVMDTPRPWLKHTI